MAPETLNVNPILFHTPQVTLTWPGLTLALGLAAGCLITARRAAQTGIPLDDVYNASIVAIVAGLLGARLFHVVDAWGYYAEQPWLIPAVSQGGLALYGGIIVGGAAAAMYLRLRHRPIGKLADAAAPALLVGIAIGRIGDVLAGAPPGRPTTSALAIAYVNPATFAAQHGQVYPAMAIELAWDLLAAGVIWRFSRQRQRSTGLVFWLALGIYGLGRFGTGFLRDDLPDWLGLSQGQWLGLASAVLALPIIAVRLRHARRPRHPATDGIQ